MASRSRWTGVVSSMAPFVPVVAHSRTSSWTRATSRSGTLTCAARSPALAAAADSSWLDVRFANADVTHRDGPGEPSHLTGNGRVTWGPLYLTYDIDAQAAPLSLGMIARSYPKLPLTGVLSGPLKLSGTVKDL